MRDSPSVRPKAKCKIRWILCFIWGVMMPEIGLAQDANRPALGSEDGQLKVMSYNLLYSRSPIARAPWSLRKRAIVELIQEQGSDLIGTQEGEPNMIRDLEIALPNYGRCGVGRDDGQAQGEHAAIFFRADRFELRACQTFWLSPTPETPGSRGWGARLPRIVTWALLVDRLRENREILFMNTHFDHESEAARNESAHLMLREALRLREGRAVVMTGDFNTPLGSQPLQTLLGSSDLPLREALQMGAPHAGPEWTYSPARTKIDHILFSNEWDIRATAILPERPTWRVPERSDHLPITAEVSLLN